MIHNIDGIIEDSKQWMITAVNAHKKYADFVLRKPYIDAIYNKAIALKEESFGREYIKAYGEKNKHILITPERQEKIKTEALQLTGRYFRMYYINDRR